MKKIRNAIVILFLVFPVLSSIYGQEVRWIDIGRFQDPIHDNGDQAQPEQSFGWYYYDDFQESFFNNTSSHMLARNWTDTSGVLQDYYGSGAGHKQLSLTQNWIPIPQADGNTIHRYFRYERPTIKIGDINVENPKLSGDVYGAGDRIPGTADVMLESWFNTMLGVTVHQRVFAWDEANHDDYHLYEWTFINTGTVDDDMEPDANQPQTIEDFYFTKEAHLGHTWRSQMWWTSAYGEFPEDSLRMHFTYPARTSGSEYDNTGETNRTTGRIQRPEVQGHAWVHVDASTDDSQLPLSEAEDWDIQPQMTGVMDQDQQFQTNEYWQLSDEQRVELWETMVNGTDEWRGYLNQYASPPALTPNHEVRTDEKGLQYPNNIDWWSARAVSVASFGPWDIAPGDSIRIVYAKGIGSIDPRTAYDVGRAWAEGTADETWEGDFKLREPWDNFDIAPTDNDKAKDSWILSGIDSLHKHFNAAQWAAENDYNVPSAPPAPSVQIISTPDTIKVLWEDIAGAESMADFAGYRVYRATGNSGPTIDDDTNELIGEWELVYDAEPGTHQYNDTDAIPGQAYYYYVAAYDDGDSNPPGVKGVSEVLESGEFMNKTFSVPAVLTSEPDSVLSHIRVVPNPFNLSASNIQYVGEQNKITFVNLPGQATIRIYTVSGDLVEVLEHTDNSGNESWGVLAEEHMTTRNGQRVVSGIYVAHIETPEGDSQIVKFAIVR